MGAPRRAEIRPARLDELTRFYLKVPASMTLGEVRERLEQEVRWVVVEHETPQRRTWSIADAFSLLRPELDRAYEAPIEFLPQVLTPAITVERTGLGIGEARWMAWRTRDRVIVVVEDGRFAGLVGDPAHSTTRGGDAELPESRFLRAKVEAPGAEQELRSQSFAVGRQHRLTITIGPHQAGLLVAESPVAPASISSAQLLKVTIAAPWITSEGQLFVPDRGASSECVLDLGVPPPGVQRVTILVFSQTGLVQTATLIGETTDGVPGAPLALMIDPSLWPQMGAPKPTLLADAAGVLAAVPAGDGYDVSSAGDLEDWSNRVFEDLEMDVQGLWADSRGLDSPETVEIMRKVARAGVTAREILFERLAPSVREQLSGDGPLQLIVRDPASDVPLELFYDAATPDRDAVLCPGAAESLRTGSCPHCRESGGAGFVCPMGFWGLRRVIGRKVVDPELGGTQPLRLSATSAGEHRTLAAMDVALVARSARVQAQSAEVLIGALRQADVEVAVADNWREWSMKVSGQRPPALLIAMPHVDQTGLEPRMEIGDDELERIDISAQYVCFPPATDERPGPVVLLLGCETANAKVAHRTMTSRFLTLGAAIVLGTRMPVIAEAAPAVGAAIVRSLLTLGDGDVEFGEAVRSARCQLVAEGNLVALALVALGDGGWHVSVRKVA